MEQSGTILRRSIYTFLKDYHFFTSTPALLALPLSVSVLLSQSLVQPASPSPLLQRLHAIFDAAGFPSKWQFFSVLCLKLSQTISSFSFTLPCSLSFLLIAKASVILFLSQSKHFLPFSSFIHTYKSLLHTYVCNFVVIVSANATAFSVLFFAFNCLEGMQLLSFTSPSLALFLSAFGAILYSIILAHALIVCNFALILSGTEKFGGFEVILKACVLIRGSIPLALSLAIPINLGWAATEALFQYRVVRSYRALKEPNLAVALEGLFIAYLYSILIVLDTIVSCVIYKNCRRLHNLFCYEDEFSYKIEIGDEAEHTKQGVKSES